MGSRHITECSSLLLSAGTSNVMRFVLRETLIVRWKEVAHNIATQIAQANFLSLADMVVIIVLHCKKGGCKEYYVNNEYACLCFF